MRRIARYDIVLWFGCSAAAFVIYSVACILRWAPHALYADQWRQYAYYLTLPFPSNVTFPDNGHRSIVPNLIAWLETLWLGGNQWLQIGCGIAFAMGTGAIVAWNCARDRSVTAVYRAAAAFLAFLAIFWLGNARTLLHSTELLHTTLTMFCLALALHGSVRATGGKARGWLVVALGAALVGTFSFGYGVGIFVAILAVLVARKAERRHLVTWLIGLAVAVGLYFALPGRSGVTASMTFAPLESLVIGARWLGAPFVVLTTYLWDPAAYALLPNGRLSEAAHAIATGASQHLPDLRRSILPQAVFGALGMLALLASSLRQLRSRAPAEPMQAFGLGIAWFGLAAAGIIALSRLGYFHEFPDQIYATRYLPWPCLFWMGLGLIALGRPAESPRWAARATLAFAALLPLLAWPMHFGGTIYAALVRGLVDNTAIGSVVGVLERGASLGESVEGELVPGVLTLRSLRVAQFGGRVAALIGEPLPADFRIVADASMEVRPVADNLLGDPGTAVTLRSTHPVQPGDELLLVDAGGTIVGSVISDPRLEPPGYSGYARGIRSPADLRAAASP